MTEAIQANYGKSTSGVDGTAGASEAGAENAGATSPVVNAVRFVSLGLPEDLLQVAAFAGREEISRVYRFEVELCSDDPNIDLAAPLEQAAELTIESTIEGRPSTRTIHGILADFEFCGESDAPAIGRFAYRAVLVPRIWLLGLSEESRVFQHLSVPQIALARLSDAGIDADACVTGLEREYAPREYVVQFGESALAFASRLLEHEGIHYHFDQSGRRESIVFGDSNAVFTSLSEAQQVPYLGRSTAGAGIRTFTGRRTQRPHQVVLRDYDEHIAHVPLRGNAIVDESGHGSVFEDGANIHAPEEALALAQVRAETLQANSQTYEGTGTHPAFRAGARFEQTDHMRREFNAAYILTSVEHRCSIAGGVPRYENRFRAIAADCVFRPERITPRPRLHGSMRAEVDASGPGENAEADALGRYRLIMPFDESGAGEGRATLPVRMAQPYGGPDRGMHFPLAKGAEVVWTCIDGDPDRPIISGTVANADQPSIAAEHANRPAIRTASGARIEFGGEVHPEPHPGSMHKPADHEASRSLSQPRHLSAALDDGYADDSAGTGTNDTFFRVHVPHGTGNSYLRMGETPPPSIAGVTDIEEQFVTEFSKTRADLRGVVDYTSGNRSIITNGDHEEVVHGNHSFTWTGAPADADANKSSSRIAYDKWQSAKTATREAERAAADEARQNAASPPVHGPVSYADLKTRAEKAREAEKAAENKYWSEERKAGHGGLKIYSQDFYHRDFMGLIKKSSLGFVHDFAAKWGDSESWWGGMKFSGSAGTTTGVSVGAKVDFSISSTTSLSLSQKVSYTRGRSVEIYSGTKDSFASSKDEVFEKSWSLTVAGPDPMAKKKIGLLCLPMGALAVGGLALIASGVTKIVDTQVDSDGVTTAGEVLTGVGTLAQLVALGSTYAMTAADVKARQARQAQNLGKKTSILMGQDHIHLLIEGGPKILINKMDGGSVTVEAKKLIVDGDLEVKGKITGCDSVEAKGKMIMGDEVQLVSAAAAAIKAKIDADVAKAKAERVKAHLKASLEARRKLIMGED